MARVETTLQQNITPMPKVNQLLEATPPDTPAAVGYLASFAMTALATAVAVGIDRGVTIPNLSLIFVVPVIIAGVGFGLGPSLLSAVLGALAFNFFLTEPRYTLMVNDPANVWAIGLLFLIGLIVSGIAFTSRRRATDAALLRWQMTILEGYSRDIVMTDDPKAIVSTASRALAALFDVPVVVVLIADGEVVSIDRISAVDPQEADLEAARSSLAEGRVARAGVYPGLASRFDFWPVATSTGHGAVIGLAFDPDERPPAPDTLVGTVGSVLALALDRQYVRDGSPAR